jgi:hypothetical protein
MSAENHDGPGKRLDDALSEGMDSDYGDEMSLDLEMERIIKHLDEVTAEHPQPRLEAPRPPLPAKAPVPARDPRPAGREAQTMRLERSPGPPPKSPAQQVLELVEEVDDSYGRQAGSPGAPPAGRPIGSLSVEEFGEVVAKAVESALRRFYTR